MLNPRSILLGTYQITAAIGSERFTPVDISGAVGASLLCRFLYGSGGATVTAKVQTSFDGIVWFDVANFAFTTAAATKIVNLNAQTAKAVASYADLTGDAVLDGFLGQYLRLSLASTGTYAGATSIEVYANVR